MMYRWNRTRESLAECKPHRERLTYISHGLNVRTLHESILRSIAISADLINLAFVAPVLPQHVPMHICGFSRLS